MNVLSRLIAPLRETALWHLALLGAVPFTVLLVCLRFGMIMWNMAPAFAQRDAAAFYVAARAYQAGLNPYGEVFWELTQALYGYPLGAFFNPPHALPLLAPLGLLSPQMAGLALMVVAVLATGGALLLALSMVRSRGFVVPQPWAIAAALAFGLLVFQPLVPTVVYGHIKPVVLLALITWAFAARAGWWPLQAVAVVVAMAMPQFAVPVLIVSAMVRAWRLGAFVGLGLCGVLYLAAAVPYGISSFGFDWLAAAGAYTGDRENAPGVLVGAAPLLDLAGVGLSAPVTLFVVVAGGLVIWRSGTSDPLIVALGAAAVGILAAPTHLSSSLMLFPALVYVLTAGPIVPRVALAISLTVLGLTDWFVDLNDLFESRGSGVYQLRALGCTAMVVVAFGALMGLQHRESAARSI